MRLVKDAGNVERLLGLGELGVALDVAGHTVDDVRDGLAFVCVKGVVVDNGGLIDGAVAAEGKRAFIPVDVAGKKGLALLSM